MYVSTLPMRVASPLTRQQATLGRYRIARSAQITRVRRRHSLPTLGAITSSSQGVKAAVGAGAGAATAAVAMIPVVGPFLAPLVAPIVGLFTQHHAQAMAVEAQTLNSGNPNFLTTVQSTMQALSGGSISESDAISALQQALAAYYASVASIIKKAGSCTSTCSYLPGSNCNKLATCNAACVIGCINENTVNALTAMIQKGGGSYTIPATPNNGAIQGTPSFTVTYSGAGAGGLSSVGAGGIPIWVWLAGAAALLLFLVMR